jgi:MFS family permease
MCGTWMQVIGVSWLVLKLTHSGTQIGFVVAAQFLPILLLGVWGGVVADRFDKRRTLYFTQTAAGLLALVLGLLVISGHIHLWMVYALAAGLGLVTVIDSPTRQTFVIEMVGRERLKNAVTLNSTIVNGARIIGPSIAGVLILTVGIGQCFLINAASYIAVLIALAMMDKSELHATPRSERVRGQIRAGLRYVWGVPRLRSTLIMMFIIGTFAYEFPVILPLFATVTLHGNASTYAALTAAMGIGSVAGGLYAASRNSIGQKQLIWTAVLFGCGILLAAAVSGLVAPIIVLGLVGALSVLFISVGNTTLQLTSDPTMRGRVMSLWTIAFLGTTPIGGPIIGAIADHTNPRVGLAAGGVSALLAAGLGFIAAR